MQQKHRSSIVISALLTTLVMTVMAGGLLAYNGMLSLPGVNAQGAVSQATQEEAPIVVTVQPVLVPETEQAAPVPPLEMASFAAPAVAATVNNDAVATQAAGAVTAQNAGDAEVVAAYQAQLEEAYAALQDAYTQIDTLQSAQAAPAPIAFHESDDNEHEASHSVTQVNHEGGEQEHGDD